MTTDTNGQLPPDEDSATRLPLLSRLMFLLLLPLLLLPVCRQMGYTDFWMHAATGRWIWSHHAIPHVNLFMYTAEKYPFIDHTWLSQVVLYLCWKVGGLPVVRLFQLAMTVLSYWILWRFWLRQKAPAWAALLIFPCAIYMAFARFTARPELFSGVGIALFLTQLYEYRRGQRTHLWWLPVYMLLWVNAHGGILTGLVLMAAFVAGEAITQFRKSHDLHPDPPPLSQGRETAPALLNPGPPLLSRGRETAPATLNDALPCESGGGSGWGSGGRDHWKHLLLISGLTFLVTFLNPYGPMYYVALSPARLRLFTYQLTEWWSLAHAWPSLPPLEHIIILGLACLTAILLLARLRVRSFSWSGFFIFAVTCWLLYTAQRQVWTFGQVCLVVCAVQLGAMAKGRVAAPRAWWRMASVALCGILPLFMFATTYAGYRAEGIPPGLGVFWEDPPEGTIRFIEQHHIRGRMYNFMDDGGYLVWRLYPQQKVFIDQLNANDVDLLKWDDMVVDGRDIDKVLDHFKFDYIIVTNEYFEGGLVKRLTQRRDWALVYWDGVSCLYVRRLPRFSSILQTYEYLTLTPFGFHRPTSAAAFARVQQELGRALKDGIPTGVLYRRAGTIYSMLGDTERTKSAYTRAVKINPWETRGYIGLAEVALSQRDWSAVESNAQKAISLNPRWGIPWRLLGLARLQQNDAKGAVKALAQAVKWSAPTDESYRILGMLRFQRGEDRECIRLLSLWLKAHREDMQARVTLAQAYMRNDQPARARSEFREMTKLNPNYAPAWYGLSAMESRLHNTDASLTALKKAVKLDPRLRNLARQDPEMRSLESQLGK